MPLLVARRSTGTAASPAAARCPDPRRTVPRFVAKYGLVMSLTVSASADITAPPQAVLEFVLDLERYRHADHKIARVSSVTGPDEAGRGSVRLWGRLPGLPLAPDRQDFTLDRWSHLTFVGAPRQPGRLLFDFVGTFECTPLDDDTTRVTHAYEFTFRSPFRWIERRMAQPLSTEIEQEVARLAAMVGDQQTD